MNITHAHTNTYSPHSDYKYICAYIEVKQKFNQVINSCAKMEFETRLSFIFMAHP